MLTVQLVKTAFAMGWQAQLVKLDGGVMAQLVKLNGRVMVASVSCASSKPNFSKAENHTA